ncbi:MAG: CHAT domain-containing tetratricopeptide repeat protein [Bacteroidota bacterium]
MSIIRLFLITYCIYLSCIVSVFSQHEDQSISAKPELSELIARGEKISQENIDSALVIYLQVQGLAREQQRWEDYLKSLNALAVIHYIKEDYEQYEQYAMKAYKAAKKYLGEQHEAFGIAINNLNSLYYRRGNYRKSLSLLEQSLQIKEAANDSKDNLAAVYANMGNAYYSIGDFDRALEFQKKALEYRLDALKVGDARITNNLKNIGMVFKGAMVFDSALVYYNKCILAMNNPQQLKKKRVFHSVISSFHGLAETHLFRKEYTAARKYLERALSLQKEDKTYRKAYTYELMARIDQAEGRLATALQNLTIANDLAQKYYKSNGYPKLARKQLATAKVHTALQNYSEAQRYFQKALQTLSPAYPLKDDLDNPPLEELLAPPDALKISEAKAQMLWQYYQQQADTSLLTASLRTYQNAAGLIRELRQGILTGESKNTLAERSLPVYEGAIKAAVELYQKTQSPDYLRTAFQLAESNKALLLLESVNEQVALGHADLPDSLLERENALRIDLAYYRRIMLVEQQRGDKANAEKIKGWKDQLFTLQEDYDRLSRTLEQNYPRYHQLKYQNAPVSVAQVQDQVLQPEQALLEYFIGDDEIYLFVLAANQPIQLHTLPNSGATLENIDAFKAMLQTPPDEGLSAQTFAEFTGLGHQLYQDLLQPALSQLPTTINQLLIIPDQQLATLPFDLLLRAPAGEEARNFSPATLDYLMEQYAVSYSYSATLLGKNQAREVQPFEQDFIGYAPSFQPAMADATRSCTSDELYSLRCNGPEVEAISQLLGGEGRYGLEAGRQHFEAEAANYRILHFASHACVDVDNPMLSKIYLADDYLSLYDLYNSGLRSELAVLSACNTGSGKLLKGEGVMSLARGFITSGCRSTLMSLWSVDDCATSDIMTQFYTHLNDGQNKAAALRQAKLDYLNSASRAQQHPYYWAAFVQFGDVRPMELGGIRWFFWLGLVVGIGLILLLFSGRSIK